MKWHGYQQHPNSHPERPWWLGSANHWVRLDGVVVHSADAGALVYEDQKNPSPEPEPLPGQVWRIYNAGVVVYSMIGRVQQGSGGKPLVWFVDASGPGYWEGAGGAELVSGPGSPWSPT